MARRESIQRQIIKREEEGGGEEESSRKNPLSLSLTTRNAPTLNQHPLHNLLHQILHPSSITSGFRHPLDVTEAQSAGGQSEMGLMGESMASQHAGYACTFVGCFKRPPSLVRLTGKGSPNVRKACAYAPLPFLFRLLPLSFSPAPDNYSLVARKLLVCVRFEICVGFGG